MPSTNCCNPANNCCFGAAVPVIVGSDCSPPCDCCECQPKPPKPCCVWAIDYKCVAFCQCDPNAKPCGSGCGCSSH